MGSVDLLLIAGLLLVGAAVYLFVTAIFAQQNEVKALSWASDAEPDKSRSGFVEFSRPLVHRFCLGLAARFKSSAIRKRISNAIMTSGLEREINVDEYIGMQILWGMLFPALLFFLDFTLELDYPPLMIAMMSLLGMAFPVLHVDGEKKKRYVSVIADLPFFIDLLALSTEAGLDFIGAIQRIVEKADQKSVLAQEFGRVLADIKLGQSRANALKAMATRLDIPEMTSFLAVLIDADQTGASISSVMKQQSVQMRVERFARAEKAGARASQTILIPLIIFILPAVFIMIIGPLYIQFRGFGG